MNMNSNFQGRRRGKSVSFRGQSNDSNFYESKPRNLSRDQQNYDNSDHDQDSRVVKLLPDANMTISVANDFRGGSNNRGRSRGSRGILKGHSFRDDMHLDSRSSDYMDEFGPSSANRGFESYPYQGNRGQARYRGFYNRPQHPAKFADDEYDERERERERNFSYNHDWNFRGRNKSTSDRSRRGRGGRGRGRIRSGNRISDDHCEGPTSGDGDNDNAKETADHLESDCEKKPNGTDSIESPIISDNQYQPSPNDDDKEQQSGNSNKEQCETAGLSCDPTIMSKETEVKPEESKETEEHVENEAKGDTADPN